MPIYLTQVGLTVSTLLCAALSRSRLLLLHINSSCLQEHTLKSALMQPCILGGENLGARFIKRWPHPSGALTSRVSGSRSSVVVFAFGVWLRRWLSLLSCRGFFSLSVCSCRGFYWYPSIIRATWYLSSCQHCELGGMLLRGNALAGELQHRRLRRSLGSLRCCGC